MRRLWTVDIETTVVVWAADRDEAEKIAEREFQKDYFDYFAAAVEQRGLPPDWDTSRPYGADKDDERTCLEIICEEQERAAAEAEKRAAWDAHPKLEIEVA